MSDQVQHRRGTTTAHATFTGVEGEVTVDTTKKTAVIHDGATAGGFPLALESHAHTGTYQPVDADLTAIAALTTAGLVERTGAGTAAIRTIGVAASADVPDRAAADTRYAPLASPTFTGSPAAPTQTALDNSTKIATTAYVEAAVAAGGGGGTPGGASGLVQYNNAGAFGGAANLSIVSGDLTLATATPAAAASGKVVVYGADLAGRVLPAFRSASGAPMPLASHLGMSRRMEWSPVNGSTSVNSYGGGAGSAGTPTSHIVSAGSFFNWCRRLSFVSTGTPGTSGEIFGNRLTHGLGDVAGGGGFSFFGTFAIADAAAVADARMFVGFTGTALATTNAEPSSRANIIGVGCDAGETTLSIMHNDASGTATKVGLGANFPANTQSTDVYLLVLYAQPQATEVVYLVRRLNTGDEASGVLTTDLPSGSTTLSPHFWRNNGTTALAVDLAFMGLFVETEQ